MKATTRRQMLAGVPAAAATTLAATQADGVAFTQGVTADDPVFAAIARHREADQALSALHDPPETVLERHSHAEQDAFLAWLTTRPTTLSGVIATLEHASRRPRPHDNDLSDGSDDHVYANLAESAHYSGDVLEAGEKFPAMIAATLRKIARR